MAKGLFFLYLVFKWNWALHLFLPQSMAQYFCSTVNWGFSPVFSPDCCRKIYKKWVFGWFYWTSNAILCRTPLQIRLRSSKFVAKVVLEKQGFLGFERWVTCEMNCTFGDLWRPNLFCFHKLLMHLETAGMVE